MIALDTNVLVYAHRQGTREHACAAQALLNASRSQSGWGWPQPVLTEFWKVVTHPSSAGGATSGRQAAQFLRELKAAGAQCWRPTPGHCERLLESAVTQQITAAVIFDLEIAHIARDNGAREIWSFDTRFRTVTGLRLVNPAL